MQMFALALASTLARLTVEATRNTFTNEFAVYVPAGPEVADALAAKHGFLNSGQIGDLQDYYLFEHRRLSKRAATESVLHNVLLTQEPEVKWFEQQRELKRVKRDYEQSVKKRDFADSVGSDASYSAGTGRDLLHGCRRQAYFDW